MKVKVEVSIPRKSVSETIEIGRVIDGKLNNNQQKLLNDFIKNTLQPKLAKLYENNLKMKHQITQIK